MSDESFKKFSFKEFLSDKGPASDNNQDKQYGKAKAMHKPGSVVIGNTGRGSSAGVQGKAGRADAERINADQVQDDVIDLGEEAALNDERPENLDEALASEMEKFSSFVDGLDETTEDAPQAVQPRAAITDDMVQERKKQTQDILQRVRAATRGEQNNVPSPNNEARIDAAARERMMYEGSDREEALRAKEITADNRTETATMKTYNPPKVPARQKLQQKTSANKPLTQKRIANRPRLIGICNQKGGVGKTTTAINLATALAAVGKNVLIIDMDPQGNASTGLGVRRSAIRTSVYDVLFEGADVIEAAVSTRVPNLYVVPSSIHLSGAEIELVTAENREYRLKKALHRSLPYDYVIVDCPPSLNLLTLNTLVAVDSILVPLQCEFYALEGLSHLVKTIERVRKSFNAKLDIHGVVLTMYDLRNKLSTMVEDDVRSHFGDKVYKTVIPRNVRLSEAPSHGLPAIIYDMKSSGAQAYIKLAREVIQREKQIASVANEAAGDDSAKVA